MTFSLKRVAAIVHKDWKDLWKNSYILITILLPLGLAAMLSRTEADDPSGLVLPINVAFAMTGAFVQATMMAEEKEKNTLRVLLLSPATNLEVMLGKSLLSSAITLLVVIGSILLSGMPVPEYFYFSIMILMLLITFTAFGTIIGLLSRTVMETSIVGMPVLLIFSYGSFITSMFDHPLVAKLVSYLPTESFSSALFHLGQNGGFADIQWNLFTMLIWAICAVICAVIIYGKRRFDK